MGLLGPLHQPDRPAQRLAVARQRLGPRRSWPCCSRSRWSPTRCPWSTTSTTWCRPWSGPPPAAWPSAPASASETVTVSDPGEFFSSHQWVPVATGVLHRVRRAPAQVRRPAGHQRHHRRLRRAGGQHRRGRHQRGDVAGGDHPAGAGAGLPARPGVLRLLVRPPPLRTPPGTRGGARGRLPASDLPTRQPMAGAPVGVPAIGRVVRGQLFQCWATRSVACCSHWA